MEYVLSLIICLSATGNCSPAIEHSVKYKDLYSCLNGGYEESIVSLKTIGREDTNKMGASIRFVCKKVKTEAV